MQIDKVFSITPLEAVVEGVNTGATLVLVVDTWGPDRGCWLGVYDQDGRPTPLTVNGQRVKAGPGWPTGAVKVK